MLPNLGDAVRRSDAGSVRRLAKKPPPIIRVYSRCGMIRLPKNVTGREFSRRSRGCGHKFNLRQEKPTDTMLFIDFLVLFAQAFLLNVEKTLDPAIVYTFRVSVRGLNTPHRAQRIEMLLGDIYQHR